MPADWQSVFGERPGTVRFTRQFHRPTNLQGYDRVLVAFDGVSGSARVSLNGKTLGAIDAPEPARFLVTELLSFYNELSVEIHFDPARHGETPGGLWGPVAIEIQS